MSAATPKITASFALLDVKRGRKALAKIVNRKLKVPVTLTGYIVSQWSGDDGVSTEFQIDVTSHKLGKPTGRHARKP